MVIDDLIMSNEFTPSIRLTSTLHLDQWLKMFNALNTYNSFFLTLILIVLIISTEIIAL